MDREHDLLLESMHIARVSRDFFVDVLPEIDDVEVRTAFKYVVATKCKFIYDIAPYLPETDSSGAYLSAAMSVEKIYVGLRRTFYAAAPEMSAGLLCIGEEQLVRSVERLFACARALVVKKILKAHYPSLLVCREAMSRLRARQVRTALQRRERPALQFARTRSVQARSA